MANWVKPDDLTREWMANCCKEPWPVHFYVNGKSRWHCQSCYKILDPPNRMNGRKGEGKVEGGNTPTLESFGT